MKRRLSSRQRIVRFIQGFWAIYHYAPMLSEIAHGLNMGSTETVRYHVRALRDAGTLEWEAGPHRTIRLKEAA